MLRKLLEKLGLKQETKKVRTPADMMEMLYDIMGIEGGKYDKRNNWIISPMHPNHILPCDGFMVSFIPYNRDNMLPPEDRTGTDANCETALVFSMSEDKEDENKTYLVLNGDHRKAFEDKRHDLASAIEYYESQKDEHGSWFSTDKERAREEAKSGGGEAEKKEGE